MSKSRTTTTKTTTTRKTNVDDNAQPITDDAAAVATIDAAEVTAEQLPLEDDFLPGGAACRLLRKPPQFVIILVQLGLLKQYRNGNLFGIRRSELVALLNASASASLVDRLNEGN